MSSRFVFFLVVMTVMAFNVQSQDPQFSQYYAAPLYLNPGFTGSTGQQRIVVNHRVQYPSLPKAFSTSSASYEFYDSKIRSGFGFLAMTDVVGSAGWRTTYAGFSYSFKSQINRNWVFSPGINFSYGTNGLDKSKLLMRDGLIWDGDGTSYDPELDHLTNSSFFDLSAGAVLYNQQWWFGVSSHHMTKPNISLTSNESRLPMKITVHGGVSVALHNGPKKIDNVHYLTPSVIYRNQGKGSGQLDAGLRYHIDPVAIGLWYKGIPLGKAENSSDDAIYMIQSNALVFIAGLKFSGFQVGYSYDFAVSSSQSTTGGAHELSLGYEFARKKKKRLNRSDKLLPCPSFLM